MAELVTFLVLVGIFSVAFSLIYLLTRGDVRRARRLRRAALVRFSFRRAYGRSAGRRSA